MGPCPHCAQGDPLTVQPNSDPTHAPGPQPTPLGDPLVERARSGDRGAFEELVRATSADIYALAFRLTGNEHDARDVVQETYLRAFRSIQRFRGESSLPTWLYRIAVNCSATLHRRRGAAVISIDTDSRVGEIASDELHDPIATGAVERDRLVRALATLPLSLRSVVVLHDVYDLTHDEIAGELHISGASSRVRLHRGRRHLRNVIFSPTVHLASEAPGATDGHNMERGATAV